VLQLQPGWCVFWGGGDSGGRGACMEQMWLQLCCSCSLVTADYALHPYTTAFPHTSKVPCHACFLTCAAPGLPCLLLFCPPPPIRTGMT
jgi:hypothetical protein